MDEKWNVKLYDLVLCRIKPADNNLCNTALMFSVLIKQSTLISNKMNANCDLYVRYYFI